MITHHTLLLILCEEAHFTDFTPSEWLLLCPHSHRTWMSLYWWWVFVQWTDWVLPLHGCCRDEQCAPSLSKIDETNSPSSSILWATCRFTDTDNFISRFGFPGTLSSSYIMFPTLWCISNYRLYYSSMITLSSWLFCDSKKFPLGAIRTFSFLTFAVYLCAWWITLRITPSSFYLSPSLVRILSIASLPFKMMWFYLPQYWW